MKNGEKKKKIGIIGHFGGNENFLDGQTVKTKILFEELKNTELYDIEIVDTYYFHKSKFKLLKDTLKCLKRCETVFVLVSSGGMKIYFPFLYYWNKFFGIKVIHDAIGGNIPKYVEKNKKYKKYLKSFHLNLVETKSIADELKNQGIENARFFPNFKRLEKLKKEDVCFHDGGVYKFCTFSRVMKEKGIEDAINAIEKINSDFGKTICTLDIYGAIDEGYKEEFEKVSSSFSDAVKYGGIIPYEKSVETIKEYYALLFPTYWSGEGFAGTVIDAFFSALPVIATDWNINSEIIPHMECGIIYPDDKIKTLEEAILWSINNKEKMNEMKLNCLKQSVEYDADVLTEKLIGYIG